MPRPRGKKPQPTFLKLVKGTRKDRINKSEAAVAPELPQAPPHLRGQARAEWDRISLQLYNSGILTKFDRGILAAYCTAWSRWVRAEEILGAAADLDEKYSGFLIQTKKNNNIIQHPMLGIANKAMADMARYASDLGMTPSARSRVVAQPPDGADDPADKYFR